MAILRADQIIYDDALENGWENYGWATLNYANLSPVHSGVDSISVSSTNYQALYLHHAGMSGSMFTNLTFWINGGVGGQSVQLQATIGGSPQAAVQLSPLPANAWQQITVSLGALGVASTTDFDGFWIQVENSGLAPTFYVDDISLVTNAVTAGTNPPVAVQVDALANRHAISPLIYGTAFATSNQLADLNFTMNRSGGNSETSYNWQLNAHNHASDFYFESIDDGNATPGATADSFVADSKNGGAQAMITIPMIGWGPILGPNRGKLASYSIAKYGPQTGNDARYFPDAGNGISSTNGDKPITWNNPNDANEPVNSTFQQGYVQHLMNAWGASTNGGVQFYIMDNEHSIWQSTHQDVHPVGAMMQEIRDKIFDYGSMVKSNDPNALVCGPEEWGWSGYLYSGYDQQWAGQNKNYNPADYPDRTANGGMDYMPWLLSQLYQHDTNSGYRLLDYFTLHCYPQEKNVGGDDTDLATVALRNQSTRQFWDTNYVDPSWINSIIMLIPRMHAWVTNYYPGTKIGITEYNWGAESDISGATAQADILGIFGREGLDLATRWTTPDGSTPTYLAMKMYRNYDGNKSTFGDTSILTTVPDPDQLAAFGAVRARDGALTLMVINKDPLNATPLQASLANFAGAGFAQRWQLTSSGIIQQLAMLTVTNDLLSDLLPSQSITLYVVPASAPKLLINLSTVSNQADLWLSGVAGVRYLTQSSTDLVNWAPWSTNTLVTNSVAIPISTTNTAALFFRAMTLP